VKIRLKAAGLLMMAAALHANDIVVYSTGHVPSGGRDSNYQILSDSTGLFSGSGPAIVVTTPSFGWGSSPSGQWIGPAPDQSNTTRAGTCCVGATKYQTTFSLAGLDPSTAVITMAALADNFFDIYLNGVHVYSPVVQMYASPITIVLKTGFISGTNTLEFDVANQGGPGGLNISISGTAAAAQPATTQVTPLSLNFNGFVGGENPPSQTIAIVAATGGSSSFTFALDSGTSGTTAPAWLLAGPLQSQATPGRILASVDLTKAPPAAGSYNARLLVSFAGNSTPTVIPVTLVLATAPQKLSVSPTSLRFNKANLEQVILVQNSGGGGPIGIGAGAPGSAIISSVKLSAPQTPTLIRVTVNPVSPGAYRDQVSLGSKTLLQGPSSAVVPVSYYVPPAGPLLGVDQTGFRFLVRQGTGTSLSQTVRVLNLGDVGSTLNWTARLVAGNDFLRSAQPPEPQHRRNRDCSR